MPSEVTHAWEVRALFKLNSKFDLANRCGQALFSPCLVALSGYLAADYLESDLPLQSSLMLAPFAVLTAAGIGLDLKETTFTEGFGNLFRLIYQTFGKRCTGQLPLENGIASTRVSAGFGSAAVTSRTHAPR